MRKKLLIFLTLVFLTPFVVNAYEVEMEWQKSWGGSKGDQINSILLTEDGGFIVVGESYSADIDGITTKGSNDAIIVKYDKDGNMLWQKNYGGSGSDCFDSVASVEDGGYIAVGNSSSTDIEGLINKGFDAAIIVKYDKEGNMLWQKSYDGNNSDNYYSIVSIEDGGFIAVGTTSSTDIEGLINKGFGDAIIVKYDKDGNVLWQKSYGGNELDGFKSIVVTDDGGFITVGFSHSNDIVGLSNKGMQDIIIVKYDKEGNMIWQKSYGGNFDDTSNSVILTEDSGFVVVGNTGSLDIEGITPIDHDLLIVKYDKEGNLLWQKVCGGFGPEEFFSILPTEDGGFVVVGNTESLDIEGLTITNKGFVDSIIVKYDKDGNIEWLKNWGGNSVDFLFSIVPTEEGGFIAAGYTGSTDIEGLINKGSVDAIIVKYSFVYNIENVTTKNGISTMKQQGKYGVITPTPNEGYEVDKIIVKDKDGNVLDVEATKQEDGTYSFELYTDVSVEVIYKEKIENPKTGILDVITIIFVGLFISLSGFVFVKRYNERLEF